MIASGTLIAGAASLAGCGQKGPLYMPDKPKEVITRPAQQGEAPPAQPSGQAPAATPPGPAADESAQEAAPPPKKAEPPSTQKRGGGTSPAP
jgi:predicted small lipoprotein YifL